METMTQEIKNHIKNLVIKYYYLPFAHITDLKASTLCDNLDCIKNRAVEILTSETETAEIYRQLIFMLSTHNVIMNSTNSYILALIRARTLRDPFEPYAKLQAEINRKAWWRKEGYKQAVKAYADLIQLNFAYAPLEHVINNFLEPSKKPAQKKILIATLQSKALIGRLPLRPFESTTIDKDEAEAIINFCIDLRRRVVEGYLTLRPRKAGDIFHYVYQWAKKESEKLEKLRHLIRRLDESVYEEIFTAPYYLHHYNILNIDPNKYELYWEMSS